jgi:hypothetical protein
MAAPDQPAPFTPSVARVLRAAAILVERRLRLGGLYQAGPDAYSAIHRAVRELFEVFPVLAVERELGGKQLQYWTAATPEETAAVLRKVADRLAERDELSVVAEGHAERIKSIRDGLAAAMGWDEAPDNYEVEHLLDEVRDLHQAVARVLGVVELAEREQRPLAPDELRRALWRVAHFVHAISPVPEMHPEVPSKEE